MTRRKIIRANKNSVDEIKMPLESLLGYQLRMASTAMIKKLSIDYNTIGFRIVEGSVLLMVEENPGVTQSQIGAMLEIKSANMVPLIAFLVENDFVKRKRIDGRSQGLFLTAQGELISKQLWECIDKNEKWLTSRFQEIDSDSLLKGLKDIWS